MKDIDKIRGLVWEIYCIADNDEPAGNHGFGGIKKRANQLLSLLPKPCPKCAERRSLGVGEKCPNCKPKPCEKCENYTTGECVSKIPCDMDYSAFKPKPCEKCGGSGISKKCPQCGESLMVVIQSATCLLNPDQFDSTKAGDYYCPKCPDNGRGKSRMCYWWKNELPCPACKTKKIEAMDSRFDGIDKFDIVDELLTLEAENRWIPVSELPELGMLILATKPTLGLFKCFYYKGNSSDLRILYTHWKPITLPALQEKGE